MKFILALSVVALAAVGCGHSNQDRPQPAPGSPATASQLTKAELDADAAALTGAGNSLVAQSAPGQTFNPEAAPAVNDNDLAFYQDQAHKQRLILMAQKRALNQAIAAKDNTVALTPELLDLTIFAAGTGFLGVNAYQGFKDLAVKRAVARKAASSESTAVTKAARRTAAAEGADDFSVASRLAEWGKSVGKSAASYTADGAPYVLRGGEAVLAAIGLYYSVGKAINTANGVRIKFTDTAEIKDLRDKVSIAESNLGSTERNLAVLRDRGDIYTP